MKNGPAVTNQSLEGSRLRRTNPHRGTQIPCGQPTSMISPCQEGKSSPDALGRSANKVFRSLQLAFAPLGGDSSSIENQTSMISPCQEGKSSPDALGRSANKVFRSLQLAFAPLGGDSSSIENQTSICCLGPAGPHRRLSL